MSKFKTLRPLVRLGSARRQTLADQALGMFEQIPTSKYEVAGWRPN